MSAGVSNMATPSAEDTEILVHITAPSRTADDVDYRQLAQAYLDFLPQTRTRIQLSEEHSGARQLEPQTQSPERAPEPSSDFATSPLQLFEINSQNISFESALDNRASPRLRYPVPQEDVVIPSSFDSGGLSQVSWCPPPSHVSDSYPLPEAGLLSISPTRVLQRYMGRSAEYHILQTPPSPSPRKRRGSPLPTADIEETSSSIPTPDPGPVLAPAPIYTTEGLATHPTSLPDPQETLGSLRQGESFLANPFPPKVALISSSAAMSRSAISPRAGSEPPPAKRVKGSQLHHSDLVRSSSDMGPIPTSSLSSSNHSIDVLKGSLEIRPPSPPVGIDDLTVEDLVLEKFSKLARDLSSRYRPEEKRPIDPFERGYWLLDCRSWSPDSRLNTWVFLNNYLRSGLAGWGTWCRRSEDHDSIRLYCWGHVVKHTYLLLYLASERHLKMTGASWFDAEGELVVGVPPQDKAGVI